MKLIFGRSPVKSYDWFEKKNFEIPEHAWWFKAKDMRAWFLKWVFK